MASKYREFAPSPHVAAAVECFWSLDVRSDGSRRVLPDGCSDLLFFLANRDSFAVHVIGVMTRPRDVPLVTGQSFFGVRFRPGMAGTWWRSEGPALTDQVRPIHSLMGALTNELVNRIAKVETVEERIALLEARLTCDSTPTPIQRGIEELVRSKGQLPTAEFAELAEVSPRQLRRICLRRVGLPPKQLARILRFRHAVTLLQRGQTDAARLAVDSGYFDQAHMIRDFHRFAGASPGRFVRNHAG